MTFGVSNPEMFVVERMTSITDIFKHWKFFLEGLERLNKIVQPDRVVSPETFLQILCDTVAGDPEKGIVFIVKSLGGERLLFMVAMDNSIKYCSPSFFVYAIYCNGKNKHVTKYARECIEEFARGRGYTELQACSPRINGSAFTLFEKRWGFLRRSILFAKKL